MKHPIRLLSVLFILFTPYAFSEPLNYNLYHISTTATAEINNDIMQVTLQASNQSRQAETANNEVNKKMTTALNMLQKNTKQIKYKTTHYQTRPVYKDLQVIAWKTSQQLELESTDFPLLTKVIGKLQTELNITAIEFKVSPSVRKNTQNQLSIEALNQFKQQAELIQKNMGASNYQIVSVNINTGSQYLAYPRPMMKTEMASSAPAIKSGSSAINVDASGQIQLMFN
ncbi:SIMPL domain-containing protein [uncultured Shewanella sp.]|uniref:SIMPL domain-containing protein n=1 Tax=uncultured Shewanella sp. TaxID=173975 RepID=UPI002624F314|nr:SIMPL domain-containing protein [uncultured Shewanella sp.]